MPRKSQTRPASVRADALTSAKAIIAALETDRWDRLSQRWQEKVCQQLRNIADDIDLAVNNDPVLRATDKALAEMTEASREADVLASRFASKAEAETARLGLAEPDHWHVVPCYDAKQRRKGMHQLAIHPDRIKI